MVVVQADRQLSRKLLADILWRQGRQKPQGVITEMLASYTQVSVGDDSCLR
jgi:hypothetical protein